MTMAKYRVDNFTDKTPRTEQDKLRTSLKGLQDVETVELDPSQSQISVSFKKQAPEKNAVAAAVKKAGFSLGAAV